MAHRAEADLLLATSTLPLADPQRLGALLLRLQPRLTAVALRVTKDPETARDVVQSAFEKVIRHGHRFHGSSRVSTWMHRIVTNEALMWLRSERRRCDLLQSGPLTSELEAPDPTPDASDQLVRREQATRLRDGISRLSREERDVVTSCGLSGLSYADYSARSGLHPAAVKSRAFRARRRLSKILEDA